MDRAGVFVDAGYLFAAGSILLCGEKLRRGRLRLSEKAFLDFLREKATLLTGLPLLRIYWYDGTDGPPSPKHVSLARQPDVKLRLGLVNRQGEQKGVDSLIVTDLINLSRNRAMAAALLLTGDEDIRVGVQQAQEYGVRVHLIGVAAIPGGEGNQAALLKQEADAVCDLSKEEVGRFLACEAEPESPGGAVSLPSPVVGHLAPDTVLSEAQLTAIVAKTLEQLTVESVQEVSSSGRHSLPHLTDALLLRTASALIGGAPLAASSKRKLRDRLYEACVAKTNAAP